MVPEYRVLQGKICCGVKLSTQCPSCSDLTSAVVYVRAAVGKRVGDASCQLICREDSPSTFLLGGTYHRTILIESSINGGGHERGHACVLSACSYHGDVLPRMSRNVGDEAMRDV